MSNQNEGDDTPEPLGGVCFSSWHGSHAMQSILLKGGLHCGVHGGHAAYVPAPLAPTGVSTRRPDDTACIFIYLTAFFMVGRRMRPGPLREPTPYLRVILCVDYTAGW